MTKMTPSEGSILATERPIFALKFVPFFDFDPSKNGTSRAIELCTIYSHFLRASWDSVQKRPKIACTIFELQIWYKLVQILSVESKVAILLSELKIKEAVFGVLGGLYRVGAEGRCQRAEDPQTRRFVVKKLLLRAFVPFFDLKFGTNSTRFSWVFFVT